MRKAIVIGVLGSALTLADSGSARAQAQAAPGERPHIEGAWILNRDMGDQPSRGGAGSDPGDGQGSGRHHGGYGGGGGGGYGGGMRGGGMRGGMGEGGGTEDREEMMRRRALMKELLEPSTRMTVTIEGDVVAFTEADGRVRKFKTDGKKEKHQYDNGTVETKSRWDKDGLVIETALQNGMKLTETYALAPGADRRQLVLQTKIEGGQRDGDDRKPITRYYDDAVEAQ
jgi:hypothetical protein